MSDTSSQTVMPPVALVYGNADSSKPLRIALGEIGAQLVCDADVEHLDTQALAGSGAGVVLISLDTVVEQQLNDVYGSLDEDSYRILFDDPEISNALEGWEHARWQRHLAAKLRNVMDWDPPRPASAQAEPVTAADNQQGTWLGDAMELLQETQQDAGAPSLAEAEGMVIPALPDGSVAEAGQDDDPHAASPSFADTPLDAQTVEDASDGQDVAAGTVDDPVDMASPEHQGVEIEPAADDISDPEAQFLRQDKGSVDDLLEASTSFDASDASTDVAAPDTGLNNQAGEVSADTYDAAVKQDWSSLEAELNAAFDSATLDSIDMASMPDAGIDESGDDWSVDSDTLPPTESGQPSSPDDEPAQIATPQSENLSIVLEDEASATAQSRSRDIPEFEAPDANSWTLLGDKDLMSGNPGNGSAAAETGTQSGYAPEADTEADESSADDPARTDQDFGLELVDPVEYLAPEKPVDISNELYVLPELMSMSEAVAPKVGGDSEEQSTASVPMHWLERVVVLGASVGGPDALREFLSHLPERFPATFILVQHLGSEFVDLMVSQFGKSCALPVRIPTQGERAVASEVLVVPSGRSLHMTREGILKLANLPEGVTNDPSINLTMAMAAETFAADAIAIIFSGMASDAVAGALEIAAQGGQVWVQDPQSCVISNMVDDVVAVGIAKFSGTPQALAEKLVAEYCGEQTHE